MPQRFCDCGHPVLVAYIFTGYGIWHLFRITSKLGNWMCCPVYWRHHDINQLL